MKKLFLAVCMLPAVTGYSQERYIGLTRDSLVSFHAKYFDQVYNNDTALLVKYRRDGLDWRYFKFDRAGICTLAVKEVPFYNDFTDLEKKLRSQKYKTTGETEFDFGVQKVQGAGYTKGKENYVLMYKPINPNLSASTRAVVYFKTK